jgi:cytochrome c
VIDMRSPPPKALLRISTALLAMTALSSISHLALAQTNNDVAAGKSLYEAKCSGCHSVDTNRIGPMHRGVVGREVASVPGFDYSPAIKQLHGVWTKERLDKWLQNPQAVAPGTIMFASVDNPVERREIIAYLATLVPTTAAKPQ